MQMKLFYSCAKNVFVSHGCDFILSQIQVGNNVQIGDRTSFIVSIAHIYIGNNVMFGLNLTKRGVNHRIDIAGKCMYDIKEYREPPDNDKDVVIDDDV